jgi:Tfp pilus assembly protein PilE
MGILASVALPQYFKSVEKSRAAEAIDALSAIVSAQERYFMKKGTYVGSLSNLYLLDVGISNLSYFTITVIGGTHSDNVRGARAVRNTAAGAGLGSYYIYVLFPQVPGTGARTWYCSPTKAGCNSFLPQ